MTMIKHLLLSALLLSACGGSTDEGDDGTDDDAGDDAADAGTDATTVITGAQLCEDLGLGNCSSLVNCDPAEDFNDCYVSLNATCCEIFDCAGATQYVIEDPDAYNLCIETLIYGSCENVGTTPAACEQLNSLEVYTP